MLGLEQHWPMLCLHGDAVPGPAALLQDACNTSGFKPCLTPLTCIPPVSPHHHRPGPGRVTQYLAPGGPYVRMDSHLYPGYLVPPNYDSLLGKLIVWGEDREAAIARMLRALDETVIVGVPTTGPFHKLILQHEAFKWVAGAGACDVLPWCMWRECGVHVLLSCTAMHQHSKARLQGLLTLLPALPPPPRAGDVDTGFIPKYQEELRTPPPPSKTKLFMEAKLKKKSKTAA